MTRASLFIACACVAACGPSSAPEPSALEAGQTIEVREGESIQAAVDRAEAGDRIRVYPGVYHETVYIDVDRLRLEGVVVDGAWPTLDGRSVLNDGVLVGGHGVSVEGLHVRRYKGNGIMTQGVSNFRITGNVVEGPSFYGIFPQFGLNGLVSNNVSSGIEDAAIYVSMSQHVDVMRNTVFGSVIGIESENSRDILIEDNQVTGNSVGIALSQAPGRQIKRTSGAIVRGNFISENNAPNFGREGALSAAFPTGTGIFLWAVDRASVEDNAIRGHEHAAIVVADHAFVPAAAPEPATDPNPDRNRVLRNRYVGNARDLEVVASGQGNCVAARAHLSRIGAEAWADCPAGATTRGIASHQLPEAVPIPEPPEESLGELTWAGVCSGCHAADSTRVGPPISYIRRAWAGRPEEMADWIANPERRQPGYPEMPQHDYLGLDVRLAVARYVLDELDP